MLTFTAQENRVIGLLIDGLTNIEIGKALHVTEDTVKTHLRKASKKADARGRAHLVALVLRDADPHGSSLADVGRALAKHAATRAKAPAGSHFAVLYDDIAAAVTSAD